MSKMMRHMENEVEKIANETGYEWDYLMDRVNEQIEDGQSVEDAIKEVSIIASEQDY